MLIDAKSDFEMQFSKRICLKFFYTKDELLRPEKFRSYEALLSYHLLWDTLYFFTSYRELRKPCEGMTMRSGMVGKVKTRQS